MEENNNMTAERSLEIITEQIERSQRTITKNAALPLMWWGVCVIVFAPLVAYLWKNHGGPIWNTLWAVMWIIGFIGNWIIDKKKETVPSTFIIKTIDHVWSTFGLFCGSISIFFCLVGTGVLPLKLVIPNEYLFSCITSIISLCFGMSTSITGRIVKNRLIERCGFIAGLGGFIAALFFSSYQQLFVMTGVTIIALIIPGVVIYLQNKQ